MELPERFHRDVRVFSGSVHPELAEATAEEMGIELGAVDLHTHANGELYVRYDKNIRKKDVFIIQPHVGSGEFSPNDAIMEHIIMIDAARRASAREITAVAPVMGYMRQDRKATSREPITAARVARMLTEAGAHRLLSLDVHTQQQQGFVNEPYDHLTASLAFEKYMKTVIRLHPDDEYVIVSPDAGRGKASERLADNLDLDDFIMTKSRAKDGKLKKRREITRDVTGQTCVIYDDMIDTAGTLISAAQMLKSRGAKKVIALASHGFFSGPALERLAPDRSLDAIVVTDTAPQTRAIEALGTKLEVISMAPILGDALVRIASGRSLSKLFRNENSI